MDWAARRMASFLGIPLRTPASAIASIIMYRNAGELPASPVMVSIWSSVISTASPTASRAEATIIFSSGVREPSVVYPMAPSRTATQWLGITLTTLVSGTYDFIPSTVSPATTLRTMDPGATLAPSSMKTWGTCLGLTAMTTSFVLEVTSAAVWNISTPYVSCMCFLVPSLGAQAMISSFEKTFFEMSPAMRASAIFPAPMNPMRASDMASEYVGIVEKGVDASHRVCVSSLLYNIRRGRTPYLIILRHRARVQCL